MDLHEECKILSPWSMASRRADESRTSGLGIVRPRKDRCVVSQVAVTPIRDVDLRVH